MLTPMMLARMGAGSPGFVNLDGHTVDSDLQAATAHVGIRFNADGTVQQTIADASTWVQIDTATDWIVPNGKANSSYEVRYTGASGDTFTTESSAEDAWVDLSVDRFYRIARVPTGTSSRTCTFEIRLGATTLASASYTISVNSSG